MKKYLSILLVSIIQMHAAPALYAQDEKPGSMLRVYWDDDFLNDRGKGTDDAYTDGIRFDFFYDKAHKSKFFLDRWMPKAGDSSINTFGVGLTQLMYTPNDITSSYYQPHDYPWSAGLFATHTLYSFNPQKQYDWQTELVGGVMGPDALGGPVQSGVHHTVHDPAIPQGWNNQFGNDVLLNLNFTAEKELAHFHSFLELVGSSQASVGTMADAFDIGPTILIGRMNQYFKGFMGHNNASNGNKLEVYFKFKPGVQFVGWNSLLEGGIFDRDYSVKVQEKNGDNNTDAYAKGPHPQIENLVTYTTYSLVVAYRRFSLSYSQTHNSELVKDTYSHTYGNLTATYSF